MFPKLLTAGTALLLATPALARPAANLSVDNHWGAPVQVFVDNRPLTTVGGYDDLYTRIRPGWHEVEIRTLNGTLLERDTSWFHPHRMTRLDVSVPMTTLVVTNTGHTPLYVEGCLGGRWVQPGRTETARVPAGQVDLTASLSGRRGNRDVVDQKAFWAEPGTRNRVSFAHVPPPARMVFTNTERFPVRVLIDGRSRGRVAPGARIVLSVEPGRHVIEVTSPHGHVVYDDYLRTRPGSDHRITIGTPARPPRPGHRVAASGHRPR